MKEKVLICIPTYNEKDNIIPLVERIKSESKDLDILVIDDNSPDGTAGLVKKHESYSKNLFLLERQGKKGLGKAYLAGFRWAIRKNYHFVIQCDADFSHNPKYLPEFLKKLRQGYDLVIGSRNIPGGGVSNWGYLRQFISRFGSFYARSILGLSIRDLTGGYNTYRVSALKSLSLDQINSNGYVFQIELKYRSALKQLKIEEIPIIFKDRVYGDSKMNLKIVLEAFWRVLYLKILCKENSVS